MEEKYKALMDKFSDLTQWPKRIIKLKISGIHGFKDKEIEFRYPVVAIAGENGTGKSTILKSLACVFEGKKFPYAPGYLFPKTFWDDYEKAAITYDFILGREGKQIKINKPSFRWRTEEKIAGDCLFLDVNRIKSLESLDGYAKLAKEKVREVKTRDMLLETTKDLAEIMARNYRSAKFVTTNLDSEKEVGILGFDSFKVSQFHQGTGESITLTSLSQIDQMPKYSLLLIDEIESSLHPRAQKKLIRKLLDIAVKKKIQIIFTTHSEYILNEIPLEFRILLKRISDNDLEVFYEPSTEFCLTAMDDEPHGELVIAMEDQKSICLLKNIIRRFLGHDILSQLNFIPLGSDTHVELLEKLYLDKKLPIRKFLGIVDSGSAMKNTVPLPGIDSPEKQVVFDIIKLGKFSEVQCVIPDKRSLPEIKNEFMKASATTNPHKILEELSVAFCMEKEIFWDTLSRLWVTHCSSQADCQLLLNTIQKRLSGRRAN